MLSPSLRFHSNRWRDCRFLALALLVSHPLWSQTKVLGPRDYPLQSCSSTPASGYVRQCADTATGNLICTNALGGSCAPNTTIASGSMSLPVAAVTANNCSATATTAPAPGALSTDTVPWSFSGDVTGITGYGGGVALKLRVWTTTNTVNVKLCNETASSITPGAASINWSIPGRSPAPTIPTIQHHTQGACTPSGGTTCTLTGQIIGVTGNAGIVQMAFCWNASCSGTVTPACGLTVADGTNTYTLYANASAISSTANIQALAAFVAPNATAGTYTITATATGTGCTINFGSIWFVDVTSVAISPLDNNGANITTGNAGPAMNLVSAGNLTYANEMSLVVAACWSSFAISPQGSYTMLDRTPSTYYANFYLSSPPQGAATTFNASCSSSSGWSAGMLSLHN